MNIQGFLFTDIALKSNEPHIELQRINGLISSKDCEVDTQERLHYVNEMISRVNIDGVSAFPPVTKLVWIGFEGIVYCPKLGDVLSIQYLRAFLLFLMQLRSRRVGVCILSDESIDLLAFCSNALIQDIFVGVFTMKDHSRNFNRGYFINWFQQTNFQEETMFVDCDPENIAEVNSLVYPQFCQLIRLTDSQCTYKCRLKNIVLNSVSISDYNDLLKTIWYQT